MAYTLPLAHNLATLDNVGGKGMSLSKLVSAGIPVPEGFHVTTDAYRCFVKSNGIEPKIGKLLQGIDPSHTTSLEKVSEQIHVAFSEGTIPRELEKEIAETYHLYNDAAVAVRSSATAEDLPGASFAGQQDTYLNIHETDEVLFAIKRCWASLWTARAISYRLLQNIDQEKVALAVVVQKLVFSDVAGVLFTANPVNGKRDELVINASWGLGEAVVSSLVTPDTSVVEKSSGKILTMDIVDKQIMTVCTMQGTEEKPVPDKLRKKSALNKEQIKTLARLGQSIEEHYHMPMDVEWALEKGNFYVVQARPITVLPVDWKPPEDGVYYTKGSLAEHLPSPISPLFSTLGLESVNKAAFTLWQHMFGNAREKLWPKRGAYTTINGYVYMSTVFKPLLIMAKSFSLRSMKQVYQNAVSRYREAYSKFTAVTYEWEEKQLDKLSAMHLLDGAQALFAAASDYFTGIQLCLPSAMTSEVLLTKLYGKLANRLGISDISVFLLGFDTASLESEKSLYDIAMWVRQNPALKAYVKAQAARQLERDYGQAVPPGSVSPDQWLGWKRLLMEHQEKYSRTCYEYDFMHPTPQEIFTPTMEYIKGFVAKEKDSPIQRQKDYAKRREESVELVLEHTRGPRRRLFIKLLRWAQDTGSMRENAIYHMGMAHPQIRRMLGVLSHRLIAGGAIDEQQDIYFLEKAELVELAAGLDEGTDLRNMSAKITERKEKMKNYAGLTPPLTIPERYTKTSSKNGTKTVQNKNGQFVISGIGTSAGTVTATACILHGPADFDRFQPGDILVAVTTTPAWTPLFASASAVVTDIGGPLSHSSIVAREYGIPAVMAVHNATRAIRSGQTITVDGGAGTVVLHEEE